MKYLIFTLNVLIATSAFSQSSITNPDFETWSSNTDHPPVVYDQPEGWGMEACASAGGPWVCDIWGEKSTDAQNGSFAMKITNTVANTGTVLLASATQGDFGQPFTADPTAVNFWFKTNLLDYDSLNISVSTFDSTWNVYRTNEMTIGNEYASYTKVTMPLLKALQGTPERIIITFSMETPDGQTHNPNSSVLVDNITFEGVSSASVALAQASKVITSSNPVGNEITFSQALQYQLLSLDGSVVSQGNTAIVNVSGLPSGIYLLKGVTASGTIVQEKIVKQ